MESKIKLLGHPIHPMLIVLPMGLLPTAALFDVAYLITRRRAFSSVASWNIAAGSVGGLGAALFGAWDWLHIPDGTRAKRVGLWHGVGNVGVVGLSLLSLMRRQARGADATAYLMSFTGVALATVTGWLGGELVDRLGVGVDPGAHLNAPSSLTSEKASH